MAPWTAWPGASRTPTVRGTPAGASSSSAPSGPSGPSGGGQRPAGRESQSAARSGCARESTDDKESSAAGAPAPAPVAAPATASAAAPAPASAVAPAGGRAPGAPGAARGSTPGGGPPMSNYAFFVKYTYSNECALLAYNFHEQVTKLGVFEHFAYGHDHRLISVTLAYIFYRYQVHHCDMALDLAVTLVYLEDVCAPGHPELPENYRDAFNLVCYLAFLAHAFNADRTIRLSDWYKEIGWRSFRSCQQLNGYVFFLFSNVRRFGLRVDDRRVKRYIQKLCNVPSQIRSEEDKADRPPPALSEMSGKSSGT